MANSDLLEQFEEAGPEVIRNRLLEFSGVVKLEAIRWLAQKDRETRERKAASSSEQMALAREANSIARTASDSAKRSAEFARTSNIIASAALIAAIIAIVVSIIGLRHTDSHDDTRNAQTRTQTH